MLKLEKWDERAEVPHVIADEAYIKSQLDGWFMEWEPSEARFTLKKKPLDFMKNYSRERPACYSNQYLRDRVAVDPEKLKAVAEAVIDYFDVTWDEIQRRIQNGCGQRHHIAQKVFILCGRQFLGAHSRDFAPLFKRDVAGMGNLMHQASEYRFKYQYHVDAIAQRMQK